MLNIRT